MHLINADLHCHSQVSDGTLSPEALAERAFAQGVELWSLTDHDEVSGQQRAREAALALGMDYLTGTEISVSFIGETVHIVGLGFDAENEALRAGLAATRSGRRERARQMAAGLAQLGIAGAFEGALRYVANPDLISRTHFARFLVDSGVCPDTHSVFRRYLTPGNPGYVPHRWPGLGEAVGARARALENQVYIGVSQVVGDSPWSLAVDINNGYAALYGPVDTTFPEDGITRIRKPQSI